MARRTRLLVLAGLSSLLAMLVALLLSIGLPAHAANRDKNLYELGLEFYQTGDYVKACLYLEHVARLKPTFWPAHYALGNTYMKMGKLEMAKSAYMSCLYNKPNIPTCKNCSKAVDYLITAIAEKEKNQDPNALVSPVGQKKIAQVEVDNKAETEAHVAQVKTALAKRDQILAEGEKEAAALRSKLEEQLRWIDENTNLHVINRETGVVRTGLDVYTHAELTAECDAQVKRVLELAEVRARGIQIPKAPTIGTSLNASNVHPSSNAYVRHYKHPTTHSQPRKVATGTGTASK